MSNLHQNLPEELLHNAKGFTDGSKGDTILKNQAGAQIFTPSMILPNALAVANCTQAPPTEVAGDVYLLDNSFGTLEIVNIVWQSGNTVRYTFAAATDLSAYQAGDYVKIASCTNTVNDGLFAITTVNDVSDWIEITNEAVSSGATDETGSPGNIKATFADWDGCQQNSWVKFNGSIWEEIVPTVGQMCYLTSKNVYFGYKNSFWGTANRLISKCELLEFLVSQSSTSAPTMETLINHAYTEGTHTYDSAGGYTIKFVEEIFADESKVSINLLLKNPHSGGYDDFRADYYILSTTELKIKTFDTGVAANDILNRATLQIKIYE